MTIPATRCLLDAVELPIQFSYKPPSPNHRFTVHQTGDGGQTIQGKATSGTNGVFSGDAVIQWKIQGATYAEWKAILAYYTSTSAITTIRTFKGYWGEEFKVLCLKMEPPTVRATVFELAGEFQITQVVSWSG